MNPQPATSHPTLDPATIDDTLASVLDAQRPDPDRTPDRQQVQRQAAAALLASLDPHDPIEAAYAARAAAAHYGAMECFRRAMLPETPDSAAIRWQGKAIALSHMMTQMVRAVRASQAATADAKAAARPPAAQPQPARPSTTIRPAASPSPANARVGKQDPMPSERPFPLRAAAGMHPVAPPRFTGRAALLASTSTTDAVLAAAALLPGLPRGAAAAGGRAGA